MLLAAGLGTRLKPLTYFLPKPVVPVLNRPLALYSLDQFRAAGIKELAVNLHHMPESVKQAFASEPESILYSYENPILGTAGGIGKIRDFFRGSTFIVANGKIYCEEDLNTVLEHHRKSGSAVTLVLVPPYPQSRFNPVLLDSQENIVGFARTSWHSNSEPNTGSERHSEVRPYIFTGIHVLEEVVLDFIPEGPCDTVMDVYPKLMEKGYPVRGFISSAFWREFSTPARYLRNSFEILERKGLSEYSHCSLPAECRNVIAGEDISVDKDAHVERTVLWNDVSVGAGCSLQNVIVVDGVRLPTNTSVENAIVTPFRSDFQDQIADFSAEIVESNIIWPLTSD
jgi:NDP-sugar pyrophosphorylase family protein